MEPGEALSTTALVSVTLAGFTGVVVVFGRGTLHEWPRVDRFRLRLLLTFSLLPLALSLAGLALLATEISRPAIWGWSSAIATAFLVPAGLASTKAFRSFPQQELRAAGASRLVFYGGSVMGIASSALQILNFTWLHAFWPFYAGIILAILGSTVQFARLVLNPPTQP